MWCVTDLVITDLVITDLVITDLAILFRHRDYMLLTFFRGASMLKVAGLQLDQLIAAAFSDPHNQRGFISRLQVR
jgi:hypothetical protein